MKQFLIAILLTATASAEPVTYWIDGHPATLWRSNVGGTTYTRGTYRGQFINTATHRHGNQSVTTGQWGGQSYYNNSSQVGNFRYSHGSIGNTPYRATTVPIGNYNYTNATVGPRR